MKTLLLFTSFVIVLFFCCKNDKTRTEHEDKRIFYRILDTTVYTYQKFYILNNEIVLNCLDMENYGYHITKINKQGDSIIDMYLDKELDILKYNKGQIVLYDSYLPNSIQNISLCKHKGSHIWKVIMNGVLYKFSVIDSLDINKTSYQIDTVNYWLRDVE